MAKDLASAADVNISSRLWAEHFGDIAATEACDLDRIEAFKTWLTKRDYTPGYINRILSVGRAALMRAYERRLMSVRPVVKGIAGYRGPPKGRPLVLDELKRFYSAARAPCEEVFRPRYRHGRAPRRHQSPRLDAGRLGRPDRSVSTPQAGYRQTSGEPKSRSATYWPSHCACGASRMDGKDRSFASAASRLRASRRAGAIPGPGQGWIATPTACGTLLANGCVRRVFRLGKSLRCSGTRCPATASPRCTPGPIRAI